jgi:hypothetical protein
MKHRFMTAEWIAMARGHITSALQETDLEGIDFTLCEEFTNPPDDLRSEGQDTVGFRVRIVDGNVSVDDQLDQPCDLRIVSDYDEASTIARDPDAPAAQPEVMQQRMREGRLRIEGDPADAPAALAELDIHRRLAPQTS